MFGARNHPPVLIMLFFHFFYHPGVAPFDGGVCNDPPGGAQGLLMQVFDFFFHNREGVVVRE